jgi:ribosomal protein L20
MFVAASIPFYRNKEFTQFIRNTLMIVHQQGPEQLKVKAQYQLLNQLCQQLEKAYEQVDNSQLSQQLIELDNRRDQAIVCLRALSEGYLNHPKSTHREAGEQLLACINRYGSRLYALNYTEETATLKQLLGELQTRPECQQATETLQLADVVNEMKQANQAFEKLFIQRIEESVQSEGLSNRELMRKTTDAYRQLLKHLEAHATLTPSNEYQLLADLLNENTSYFNEVVERRKSISTPELVTASDTEETAAE